MALVGLALGVAQPASGAEWPPGPRLAYVRSGPPIAGDQVISAEPSGDRWFKAATVWSLLGVDGLAYSPDGSKLVIGDLFLPSLLVTSADHLEPQPLRGSSEGFAPVYSPDGTTIAFSRLRLRFGGDRPSFVGASIWLIPAGGGRGRQLTPWRNREILIPASFSPDGEVLVAERQVGGKDGSEVVLQPIRGGRARRIAKNAFDATFSPDGNEIAVAKYVRRPPERRRKGLEASTDIFVLDAAGRALRRLTHTPGRSEEDPSWDPSGERLAFTQLPANQRGNSSIAEINADGSCRRKLVFTYGVSYGTPVWQPGPGREAGRIEC